jgi:hypothetical protein
MSHRAESKRHSIFDSETPIYLMYYQIKKQR